MAALTLGIDPGASGACCVFDGARIVDLSDLPIWYQTVNGKKRARLDAVATLELFLFYKDLGVEFALMEQVGGRPKQSAPAAFTFGYGFGLLYMALIAAKIPVETATPQSWKAVMRVPTDDAGIANRADELLPEHRGMWRGKVIQRKGKDQQAVYHDRAEAAVLAVLAHRRLLRNGQPQKDVERAAVYAIGDIGK